MGGGNGVREGYSSGWGAKPDPKMQAGKLTFRFPIGIPGGSGRREERGERGGGCLCPFLAAQRERDRLQNAPSLLSLRCVCPERD